MNKPKLIAKAAIVSTAALGIFHEYTLCGIFFSFLAAQRKKSGDSKNENTNAASVIQLSQMLNSMFKDNEGVGILVQKIKISWLLTLFNE
jgi:hypothetical protein